MFPTAPTVATVATVGTVTRVYTYAYARARADVPVGAYARRRGRALCARCACVVRAYIRVRAEKTAPPCTPCAIQDGKRVGGMSPDKHGDKNATAKNRQNKPHKARKRSP